MTPADVQALALLLQNQSAAERRPTVELLASFARLLARRVAAEHARLDYVERAAAAEGADDADKLLAAHLPLDSAEPWIERLRNVAGRTLSAHMADDAARPAASGPVAAAVAAAASLHSADPTPAGGAQQPGRGGRPARTPRQ